MGSFPEVSEVNAMPKNKSEQWIASSDGPPWTHAIGSRTSAIKAAREMRKDGFSGVRVEKCEPESRENSTGKSKPSF